MKRFVVKITKYMLGDEIAEGYFDTADTLYADVLSKWPDDPQSIFALAGLAKVAAQLGNDSQVYELVDDILAEYADHPDIGDAIFGIAEHYWKMALAESKKNRLADSSQTDNNLKYFYYANARTIWETLINNFPESSAVPESAYFSAEVCRYLGEGQRAIEGYQYVVDNFPDYIYAAIAQNKTIKMYKKFKFDGLMTKSEADQMILAGYKKMIEKFPDHSLAERAERQLKHYVLIDNPKKRFENMTQKQKADNNETQLEEGGSK